MELLLYKLFSFYFPWWRERGRMKILNMQGFHNKILRVSFSQITDFQPTQLYSFHNFSLSFILKIFLKFRKFQPRYFYKTYSYKKETVYSRFPRGFV